VKLIVARRGKGKTAGCVAYLRTHPTAYLVVHSKLEVERVRQDYTHNEHEVSQRIVAFDDVLDGRWPIGRRVTGLVIDNADLILAKVFEMPIDALAVSWPEDVRG
jgi:hypothetical protein